MRNSCVREMLLPGYDTLTPGSTRAAGLRPTDIVRLGGMCAWVCLSCPYRSG